MLIKGSRKYNFRHNTECADTPELGKMINGQALGAVSEMRYGICRMSFNGCEVIAVHNALVYLGIPQPIAEIAFYMERFKMLLGFFGCSPFKLGRALKHFGAESVKAKSPGYAEAFIITFWTGKPFLSSIHTVFCIRTDKGITVYNRYNSSHSAELFKNLEAVAGKRKTIAVYILKEQKSEEINKCQSCSEQTVRAE